MLAPVYRESASIEPRSVYVAKLKSREMKMKTKSQKTMVSALQTYGLAVAISLTTLGTTSAQPVEAPGSLPKLNNQ